MKSRLVHTIGMWMIVIMGCFCMLIGAWKIAGDTNPWWVVAYMIVASIMAFWGH